MSRFQLSTEDGSVVAEFDTVVGWSIHQALDFLLVNNAQLIDGDIIITNRTPFLPPRPSDTKIGSLRVIDPKYTADRVARLYTRGRLAARPQAAPPKPQPAHTSAGWLSELRSRLPRWLDWRAV